MGDIVAWLRAQLDQDELWALAASASYHHEPPVTVAGGMHWTWATGDNWDPVKPDPTVEWIGDGDPPTLITVETWPYSWAPNRLASGCVLAGVEEARTGDGGHIVRHDPARVVAEVAAKRAILDLHEELHEPALYEAVRWLAAPYADQPGYEEAWRP